MWGTIFSPGSTRGGAIVFVTGGKSRHAKEGYGREGGTLRDGSVMVREVGRKRHLGHSCNEKKEARMEEITSVRRLPSECE